ncbi:MAG: aspartate--tRNA(Asn) ligase [Thermoproteales archaeon]|nr:aspartate--tRNA(Asn) ligase [Thermoproteales archaeon]
MAETIEKGWVHSIRPVGKILFVILRNRKGFVQVTFKKSENEKLFKLAKTLNLEDVIEVKGSEVSDTISKVGREIKPSHLKIISRAKQPLPIDVTGITQALLPTRLDWRPLDLRKRENFAIFKIQASIVEAAEDYLREHGFIQVFTPALIGGASEGGAEVFEVEYFGKQAFLRQDPQLHRQLLMIGGFEKIFEIGPSWRAEKSYTARHLCEHRGIAVEMSFIDDEYDIIKLEEDLVCHIVEHVKRRNREDLELLGVTLETPRRPFPILEFPEIYEILEKMGKKIPYGEDYDRESEILLWKYVKKKYDNDFFFVNRFPFAVKPFYVMRVDEEPFWARSVDLLYKGLELSSGGQREHRYDKIIEQALEKGISLESIEWFAEHFKYGAPPHGGFNIGIERLTMQLLNIRNIREATLFPRDPERLLP